MSAPQVILFPDVASKLVSYMTGALAGRSEPYASGVYVDITLPNPRPDRAVIFRRDGGVRLDVVRESAVVGVNVWAKTEDDATDLANLVRALLAVAPDGEPICKVTEQSGPTAIADAQPRRYLVIELVVRGIPV